jgi:DHA1 family inner membrane transport protein
MTAGAGDERVRRWSIALVVICQSTLSVSVGGMGLFLPLVQADLGLSFQQAGGIAAATSAVYAIMQIPSGYLADRWGGRVLFLGGLVGVNALTLTLSIVNRYEWLLANQAISGFFRALVFAPGLLLITTLFPPQRRATAMGLYVAGGFSSSILLNLVGPALVGPIGWRAIFALSAVLGFAAIAGYLWVSRGLPEQPRPPVAPIRDGLRLLRHRGMWLLAVIQYVRLAVAQGLGFWLPSLIVVQKGYPLHVAGWLVAFGAALTAPSNFLGGYLADRLRNPLLIVGTSLAVLAASTTALAFVNSLWLLFVVVGVNGLFMQLYFGPLFAVPVTLFGRAQAGTTAGFSNFAANLGGLSFGYALGVVKEVTGSFDSGLFVLAGACVVAFGCVLALTRVRPPTQSDGQPQPEMVTAASRER